MSASAVLVLIAWWLTLAFTLWAWFRTGAKKDETADVWADERRRCNEALDRMGAEAEKVWA